VWCAFAKLRKYSANSLKLIVYYFSATFSLQALSAVATEFAIGQIQFTSDLNTVSAICNYVSANPMAK